MVEDINVKAYHFSDIKFWDEVEDILESMSHYRLPTGAEAIYLEYPHQAIWLSDMIGNKHCVMDAQWGLQVVRDGCYGLILLEKENE